MNLRRLLSLVLGAGLFGLTACESEPPPPPPTPPPAETAKPGAPKAKVNNDCVGPVGEAEAKALKTGDWEWELKGSTLTLKTAATGKLVLGVISDVKEDSEENKANLKSFVDTFKKKKVQAIVVAGDSGMNKDQIVNVVDILAQSGLAVFTIIGNREGQKDYADAMAALAEKHPNVLDLDKIRRVDLPQVDIVSVPGYFNPSYIHADDGCAYTPEDLKQVAELVKTANSPVLLVTHGGPKMDGPEGIDHTAEGGSVGDPDLTALIKDNKVAFGIFGNIHEAGGRATDIDGKAILAPNKPHEALYLNPGPADGVRWMMNDKTSSVGMAALLTVDNGKASYDIVRIPDPDAPQKGKGKGKAKAK